MASLVRFPKVGANVVEGTVGPWVRRGGERVRAGEPLVEIITSKATFEVESPSDGILREILAPEKSAVPVGYVLALIGEADEALPDVSSENDQLLAAFRAQALQESSGPEASVGAALRVKVRATPGARRLARTEGVDIGQIVLPPDRSVVKEDDVRRFLERRKDRSVGNRPDDATA